MQSPAPAGRTDAPWSLPLIVLGLLALAFVWLFSESFRWMIGRWQTPEYNHAYLIPLIAFYLFWIRAAQLGQTPRRESWAGVALVTLGLVGHMFGVLSAIKVVSLYSFLLVIWGLVLTAIGWKGTRLIWVPLLYLLFMIPLPVMIQHGISAELQLISSTLGTRILRLMGVSVYLEGNVIDLGVYKLQVVDACSGLRYLFPLMSFGFLVAVLFRGPLWQRLFLFFSTVPITVFMNSFRIAVIGVLVNRFGTGAAEGFLHYFEGWVIFVACLGVLYLVMMLFSRMQRRTLYDTLVPELPAAADLRVLAPTRRSGLPVRTAGGLIVAFLAGSLAFGDRDEIIPAHTPLSSFPLVIGDWRGRPQSISEPELAELSLTDYLLAQYVNADPGIPAVELYVSYYDSQHQGAAVHSPRACLPGGGWRIESLDRHELAGILPDGGALPVNRAVIGMGNNRLLVYYWFPQRGRLLTSEYAVKWYIFWDSLTRQRTDGAMVRLVTSVPDLADMEAADRRLRNFVELIEPRLAYHLPQEQVVMAGL